MAQIVIKAPAKEWTPDQIKALLAEPGDLGMHATGRALLALLARQTFDEQEHHDTKYTNGVGFTAFDAEPMTSMAEFYKKTGFLTPKQLGWLRKPHGKTNATKISKYARQLAEVAAEKVTA